MFTIGNEIREIDSDLSPTCVIIPGNVPHQVTNPFEKPLKIYYYFPEGERAETDITYYYPDGTITRPHRASITESTVSKTLISDTVTSGAIPAPISNC